MDLLLNGSEIMPDLEVVMRFRLSSLNRLGSLFSIVLLLLYLGCAGGKQSLKHHKGSYLESVRLNFQAGEEALKDEEYDKAITYFQFVRSKYPFSKYAALSDLKIADAKFAQKKWLDSASAYEVFIRLHPRHEEGAYAAYRVGVSYFHALPSDFFLLPPSTSRDQSFTKEALAAIERFIIQYPNSEYVADAKEKQALLFSYLAKHNQHIADYYQRRKRYQAAIDRHLLVESLYPETKESAESLFKAAELVKEHMKDIDLAIELYKRIVEEKPDSPYKEKAQVELERLQSQPQP